MKKVILIGGVGKPNEYVGGKKKKNKNILAALQRLGRDVLVVDTHNARRKLWRLIPIPFVLLFNPRTNVLLSSNIRNLYWLIRLFSLLKTKRNVVFIGTGGAFSKWIQEGKYKAKYFQFLKSIVVQGRKMLKELSSVGLNQGILLPNSKMIDYLPPLIVKSKTKETRFVFLSRMHEEKGVEMILDCVNKLNTSGFSNKFTVDFYGLFESEEYKRHFLNRLVTYHNVRFNGVLNLRSNEGYDELASYDVMLFPSWWKGEGFPGIVIDALITGLPIIISDWNFNADFVIEGKTGFVIKNQDPDALYGQMLDAIRDVDKYRSMSQDCQNIAMKYDSRCLMTEEFFCHLGL